MLEYAKKVEFRPDIQGLRAISVLLVVLSHLGLPWITGGFVGVDVFFVLSGFLITGLLLQEHSREGRIAFSSFYMRRLRRLLPALFIVLMFSSAIAIWLLPSVETKFILASLPFATIWASNLYFTFSKQDYFNELASKDLFVHTWSLGVEEQFYLFWPILVIVLATTSKFIRLRSSLLLLTVFSFVVSLLWLEIDTVAAFYMMPSRIWQFALGAYIFVWIRDTQNKGIPPSNQLSSLLAAAGLALIISSAFVLHEKIAYPGYWALFPSIGAALVLFGNGFASVKSSSIARFMSKEPMIWLGDRSYAIYLWHWPIIVIIELGNYSPSQLINVTLALSFTLLAADVTYRLVEKPFWKGKHRTLPIRKFLLITGVFALTLITLPFHIDDKKLLLSPRNDMPTNLYNMGCDTGYDNAVIKPCTFGPKTFNRTAVLLGDSIGVQWFSAIKQIYVSKGWRLIVLTKSACALVDEEYYDIRIRKAFKVCEQWRNSAIKYLETISPDIIIAGSSSAYEFSPYQWKEGSQRIFSKFSKATGEVVIIAGTPVLGFDGPACLATISFLDRAATDKCRAEKDTTNHANQIANYLAEAALMYQNVSVYNPADLVCPDKQCRAQSPRGVAIYRDSFHLTDSFVIYSTNKIARNLPRP